MNVGKLIIGIISGIVAQIVVFFQLQGPMKYDWFKNNYWLVVFYYQLWEPENPFPTLLIQVILNANKIE